MALWSFKVPSADYVFGRYGVTFKAGNMIASFNISIIDDNIFEIDEYFNLTISTDFSLENIIAGDPSQAIVIIVENDGECFLELISYITAYSYPII